MAAAPLPFEVRPGLTAWFGTALLIGAMSSAFAWSNGQVSLVQHLFTSIPMLYFLFICVHDGVHGCLHRDVRVSNAVAWCLATCVVLPFSLLRQAHLEHHQTVGERHDPEHIVYGASLGQLLLRLPVVPLYYLREVRHLGTVGRLSVLAHILGWAWMIGTFGEPLIVGWLLPVLLGVMWFGFTTVYVPHSAHSARLMPYFNLHSGYHHDHHRLVRYPFNQYFHVRLDSLRNHGAVPTHRWEVRWLEAATWDVGALGSPVPQRDLAPESESPIGS